MSLTEILEDAEYKELISPSNLFNSALEVLDFVDKECTLEDLNKFLILCEEEELYTYCRIVESKIKELNN